MLMLFTAELHDYAGPRGRAFGMPVNEFADQAFNALVNGDEQVSIGHIMATDPETFKSLVMVRKTIFDKLSDLIMSQF